MPQHFGESFALLLLHRAALVGALAADLAFNLVEFGDPLQRLGRGWRRRRFGNVEPLPAPMCPTERGPLAHQPPQRLDLGCGIANPEGQSRPVDLNPQPREDQGLAIERAVIGIFRDHHIGDHLLGRQAASMSRAGAGA